MDSFFLSSPNNEKDDDDDKKLWVSVHEQKEVNVLITLFVGRL